MVDEGAALSISQFRDAWRVMCAACPGSRIESRRGLEYVFSGLPIPFFNIALVTAEGVSAGQLKEYAEQARAWADGGAPWLFIVTYETLEPGVNAGSALDGCGLTPMIPLTGMVAQRLPPPQRVPADLQIALATDDAACTAIFDVNAAAYGVDLDACKPTFGRTSFWRNQTLSLGTVDGTPAATAAALEVSGYRYVALVATDPHYQRRGYAEAVMRHALSSAARAHGDRRSTLHATDAGRPIYARMGYDAIATHTAFIDKALLDGH